MIPIIVAPKRTLCALWSLWGAKGHGWEVENLWLRCYQSLVCLSYVKMLNLTFTNSKLILFAIKRLRFFFSPYPTNKILKKTSLDLSSFLGFNFDGSPIKFQLHWCRGIIVKINPLVPGPPPPPPRFRHLWSILYLKFITSWVRDWISRLIRNPHRHSRIGLSYFYLPKRANVERDSVVSQFQ